MKKHILGTDEESLIGIEKYFEKEYGIQPEQLRDSTNAIKIIKEKIWSSWPEEISCAWLGELWDYIIRAENYELDIYVEFYIYIKLCSAEWKKVEEKMYNVIDRFKIGDMSNNLYAPNILTYFPFEMRENIDEDNKKVLEMKAFGWDFIQVMMCDRQNREIFNTDKQSIDISRYGYGRGKNIYEKLKDSSFESIYLFERVLGYYLTDVIFSQIKYVDDSNGLDEIKSIIKCFCEMPCNIRKKTAGIVIKYLKKNKEYGKDKEPFFCNKEEIEAVITYVIPMIKKYFEDLCYYRWWNIMKDCADREEMVTEILKYCEEEIIESFIMDDAMGYEIKEYYYNDLNLSGKIELLEETNETIFWYKLLNGVDYSTLSRFIEKQEEAKRDGRIIEESMEDIKKRIAEEIKKEEKPEILKDSGKLTFVKLYTCLHKYIVKYSLENIKQTRLNLFSFPRI